MYFSYSVKTDVGQKRDHNEDFVAFFDPPKEQDLLRSGRLFIVADGVGGASYGERASKYAAEKVLHDYYNFADVPPGPRLQRIIQEAGNQINTFAEEGDRFLRMATTMVAAVIIDDVLVIANVGDSRAYLIRDGIANQLSKDHSFVGEMVRDGLMTEEEARTSKQKNRITRSLGGEHDVRVDIFEGIQLADGDKILLCSDGFSQYATNETISYLTKNGTADQIAEKMIAHANQQGGSDNISVILIKVSSSPLPETVSMRRAARDLSVMPSLYEELDTDHSVAQKQSFWEKIEALELAKKIGLLIVSLILIFFVIFLLLIRKSPPVNPAYPSPDATEGFKIPEKNPASYPNGELPIVATPPIDEDIQPTEIVVTVTKKPPANMCQYTITDNDEQDYKDAMSRLLGQKFSIISGGWDEFEKVIAPKIECSNSVSNNSNCSYGQGGNVSSIKTGWVIEFPLGILPSNENYLPVDICKKGGGTPVYVAPPLE